MAPKLHTKTTKESTNSSEIFWNNTFSSRLRQKMISKTTLFLLLVDVKLYVVLSLNSPICCAALMLSIRLVITGSTQKRPARVTVATEWRRYRTPDEKVGESMALETALQSFQTAAATLPRHDFLCATCRPISSVAQDGTGSKQQFVDREETPATMKRRRLRTNDRCSKLSELKFEHRASQPLRRR